MSGNDFFSNLANTAYDYNGKLEYYVLQMKPNDLGYATFKMLVEYDHNLKLCTNYRFDLAKKSSSNQIIHYKDVFKLPKLSFTCPYIIYGGQDKNMKIWIFANNYPIAKGLYFALTEKGAVLEKYRDEILVCDLKQTSLIKTVISQSHFHKAGYFQRVIDSKLFASYDVLLEQAQVLANQAVKTIYQRLNVCDNKARVIFKTIEQWFLLKKCVYVQYMVDKTILNERHNGDQTAWRNQAKTNADTIKIISYANLWNRYKVK